MNNAESIAEIKARAKKTMEDPRRTPAERLSAAMASALAEWAAPEIERGITLGEMKEAHAMAIANLIHSYAVNISIARRMAGKGNDSLDNPLEPIAIDLLGHIVMNIRMMIEGDPKMNYEKLGVIQY